MDVLSHCRDETETWQAFHTVACLCHPSQGGSPGDMQALCAAARRALGPAWPWGSDMPNMFDIYCAAMQVPNPFGSGGIASAGEAGARGPADAVAAYDPAASPFGSLGGMGRVSLAYSAAS